MWDNLADIFDADEDYIIQLLEKKENRELQENDLIKLNSIMDKKLGERGSTCYI